MTANPTKWKTWQEFKDFIGKRGNIVDMAIGIILGTAFSAIVTSLVNDIILPLVGAAIRVDVTDWVAILDGNRDVTTSTGYTEGAIVITYGNFIMAVLDFFIIALVLFVMFKIYMIFRNSFKNRYCGYTMEEYYAYMKEGKSRKEIKQLAAEKAEAEKAAAEAAAKEKEKDSTENLLKDIKALLEKQNEIFASKSRTLPNVGTTNSPALGRSSTDKDVKW